MQIVIDANIILSMLIRPGKPIDAFFNDSLEIYAPQLLFKELENNKKEISNKSKLSIDDFNKLYKILKNNIKIIPEEDFIKYKQIAEQICPDPKDIVYFALSIYLKAPLCTNEKKLREQNEIKIYATHELIRLLGI